MSHECHLITHLQLFTREDTVTKEILVIINAHIAVGLQLLEMSSLITPNQTSLNDYIFQRVLYEKHP